MGIFKEATRKKFRFKSNVGLLTVEDLWQLPLNKLDDIAISLDTKIKNSVTVSFVSSKPKTNKDDTIKLDILKEIIKFKLEERDKKAKLDKLREENQKIMTILENKKDNELSNKSIEELEKKLRENEALIS